jgi:hypothetical protein
MHTFSTQPQKRTETGTIRQTCFLLALVAILVAPAQAAYEKAPMLSSKSILPPAMLKGKNFTVQDQVKNDGLFNHYTVQTAFGTFKAGSTSDLKILINEINAIAAMKKVKTEDTVTTALKQSGQNTVNGVKNLFNDPQATLEGAASGIGSLFNRAKETVGKRENSDAEDSKFEQLVGISKSKGMIASRYGVNVYSQNAVLQEELNRLGQADFLGGLGVGVATSFVPGVGGLILSTSGTARLLNEAINTTPASELWLQNKNKLLAMGMDSDTVELFLNNPSFSPAQSTVMVTALKTMKGMAHRDLFLKVALQAGDSAMSKIITRITVMTAGYHKKIAPLKQVVPMARITSGIRRDGTQIVLLPTDYITWNVKIAETAAAVSSQAKGKLELWVFGSVSKLAAAELAQLGWKIHSNVETRLIPVQQ